MALLLLALAAGGVLIWRANTPPYRQVTIDVGGADHIALSVPYPGDWMLTSDVMSRSRTSPSQAFAADHTVCVVSLVPARPSVLQTLIDKYLLRSPGEGRENAEIRITLQQVNGADDPSLEMTRLDPALRQLVRSGGVYSMRQSSCPLGPLIAIDFNTHVGTQTLNGDMYEILPSRAGNGQQYEVTVTSIGRSPARDRLRKAMLDVVSRLRLVRETKRP
jgi:hypothetical protein